VSPSLFAAFFFLFWIHIGSLFGSRSSYSIYLICIQAWPMAITSKLKYFHFFRSSFQVLVLSWASSSASY
jgi:hypothetical protein